MDEFDNLAKEVKSMKLLLIIDLQKAFINENTEYLISKIKNILNQYDKIIFTRFINTKDSIFSKELNYYGCIDNESKKIVIDTGNNTIIDRKFYTAYNKELQDYIKYNDITEIYLCGIDIDCCVLKTAFDLFENGYNVFILKDLCASTLGIKRKNEALEILKRNIGKKRII